MGTRRNEPIAAWEGGDTVQGFALLSRKELRQDRNGRSYLDMELADATGSIAAKVWADSPALDGDFEAHHFVAFRGMVKLYRESLQLTVDECRRANDDDRRYGFDEALLIPSTREDIDDLFQRLESVLRDHVRRPLLARLATETLAVHGAALREHPAAKRMHHAYRGGLLEHVVSMAELAVKVCDHYSELDADLILLGVLFHDLGKLEEIGAMPANDYTLVGRLVGHVVLGRDLVRERCAAIPDFPEDLRLHLEHLVLSHQGRKEFSAPVEPMTAEAVALHFIDDLDAKLNQLRVGRERFSGLQYMRGFGRHLYLDGLHADEHADEPADSGGEDEEEESSARGASRGPQDAPAEPAEAPAPGEPAGVEPAGEPAAAQPSAEPRDELTFEPPPPPPQGGLF